MNPSDPSGSVVFVVVGMHRSGTSMTASMLKQAGVDMGERLIGAEEANPRGHFEDLDFVRFHEAALAAQGLPLEGYATVDQVPVAAEWRAKAREFIDARAGKPLWGWKDPRTTLFLSFWRDLLPDARFIFPYRAPWEVMDSLYRRGDTAFQEVPRFALDLWVHYNRAIVAFCDLHPADTLVVEVSSIVEDPGALARGMRDKFGIILDIPGVLCDRSILRSDVSASGWPAVIGRFFPEATEVYAALQARESVWNGRRERVAEPHWSAAVAGGAPDGLFDDWARLRGAERTITQREAEIRKTCQERDQVAERLRQTEDSLARCREDLARCCCERERSAVSARELVAAIDAMRRTRVWRARSLVLRAFPFMDPANRQQRRPGAEGSE